MMTAISVGMKIIGAINQRNQLKTDAANTRSQAELTRVEGERQAAVEKAATAKEGAERSRELQRVIGEITARGANNGFGVIGSVGTKIEESQYEFGVEQGTRDFNLSQRLTSLYIGTSTKVNALEADANRLEGQATSALISGIGSAAGTIGDYYQRQENRGEVPNGG